MDKQQNVSPRVDGLGSPPAPDRGSSRRRGVLGTLALVGPAFVVGAWQFGPGNLASAVQAGSGYGYTLIWVIVVSTVLMIAFTDMSVRLGIRVPTSLLGSIKTELGRPLGVVAGLGVFFISLMFSVGNAVGSGLGLSLVFGGSPVLWSVICSIAVGALLVARSVYLLIEKVLVSIVALMAMAFVGSVIIAEPDWAAAVSGLVPAFPPGAEILIIALVGTNFSINAAFYASYGTKERRRSAADYRRVTLVDTVPGIVAPGIMTVVVIVTAAAVLGGGETAGTLVALAAVFEPLAGHVGTIVFALGLSGAAFSSMIANATAGGQMLSDALGRGAVSSSPVAKLAAAFILIWGLVITLAFQDSPVGLIVLAQSLTVLVAPLLGILLYVMSNRASVMGDLKNRWWINALGAVGLLALLATSFRLVVALLG